MAKRKPKTEQPEAERETVASEPATDSTDNTKTQPPEKERHLLVGERHAVYRGDRGVSIQWRADRGLVVQFSRPAEEDEKGLSTHTSTCGAEEKDGLLMTYVGLSESGARALRAALDLALQEGFPGPPYRWSVDLEEIARSWWGEEDIEDVFALAGSAEGMSPDKDEDEGVLPSDEDEDVTPDQDEDKEEA